MKELAGHQLNNRNKINIMNICKLTATIVLSLFGFAQAEEPSQKTDKPIRILQIVGEKASRL